MAASPESGTCQRTHSIFFLNVYNNNWTITPLRLANFQCCWPNLNNPLWYFILNREILINQIKIYLIIVNLVSKVVGLQKSSKILTTEATTRGLLWKKVFFKISQYSQENTYARVYFLVKLQVDVCNLIKKETLAQVFSCEFCEIFKNTYFTEHFWKTVSITGANAFLEIVAQNCFEIYVLLPDSTRS